MLRKTVDFRSPIPPQSTPCRTRRSSSRREWRRGHAPPARRRSCGRSRGPGVPLRARIPVWAAAPRQALFSALTSCSSPHRSLRSRAGPSSEPPFCDVRHEWPAGHALKPRVCTTGDEFTGRSFPIRLFAIASWRSANVWPLRILTKPTAKLVIWVYLLLKRTFLF